MCKISLKMEFPVKSLKAFFCLVVYPVLLVSYTSSFAQGHFVKGEAVNYMTHGGIRKEAVIQKAVSLDSYRILCENHSFVVSKKSLVKSQRKSGRVLRASAIRWLLHTRHLPPLKPLKESPLEPLRHYL